VNRETLQLLPAWIFLFILPFTHTVALRLLGLFAATLFALFQFYRERRTLAVPAWPWLLFWALLPLVLARFSIDPAYSLGEVKTEVAYGMMAFFVFYVGIRSERTLRSAVLVLLAAFTVMTVSAIVARFYRGHWEDESFFGGTGTFSVYLVTVLPVLVLAWQRRYLGGATQAVVLLLAALGLASGFLSEQRGLWPALLAGSLCLLALLRMHGLWTPRRAVFLGAIVLTIGIALLAMLQVAELRFGTGAGAQLRADPRVQNWMRVIGWMLDRPLTGFGFGRGTMTRAFPEMWGRGDMFWHPHNLVLAYGFELGLGGVLAIVGLFAALFVHWWKLARSPEPLLQAAGIAGVLLVVAVFTRNLTNDFFQRDLALLFWAITGMLSGATSRA
jgi:O-antigen ligase